MTLTPHWKKQEPESIPKGMPPAGQAQNLSDLDVTQPSLRMAGSDKLHPGTSPQSFDATSPASNFQGGTIYEVRDSNTAKDPLLGTVFADRYEVLELLGRGGMGSVYKARNKINKNFRALKLMHAHLVADPQVFRRFQQEATAAARINHPNAITIIDMGMAADGRPYLIMDFLDGMSLSELLKYKTKLPIREALSLFTQMCGALTEAHSHGVIHRDIKPSNVMLLDGAGAGDYIVKVVDFGIAKVFPQEGDPTMKDTTTGELFGSPPYMSPEQCLGKRLDYRSDIYSMGCLMYEVLTGAPPLVGQNALGTMYRQINDMPTPLSDIKDDVRLIQRLDEIITKSLQKDPDNRYQTILDLHRDLESAGEISAKKSRALSAIGLKLQTAKRTVLNMMGSAKRAVFIALTLCLIVLSLGGLLLTPYLQTKDPEAAERTFFWQPLRGAQTPANLLYVQESQINEAQMLHGAVSQPTLQARSELANLIFSSERVDKALLEFEAACAIGEALLNEKFRKCEAPKQAIKIFAKDQLRRVQCINMLPSRASSKFPNSTTDGLQLPTGPASLASSTIDFLTTEKISDEETLGYLQAALGLSALKNSKEGDPKSSTLVTGYFDKVLASWENVKLSNENAEIFAPVLSQIVDYYMNDNDAGALSKAYLACELAEKSWKQLGVKGQNNFAIAEDKLGHILQRMGKNKAAVDYFKSAASDFTSITNSDTLDKAKALFDEADAQWSNADYLSALQTRNAALKIWSAKRSSTIK